MTEIIGCKDCPRHCCTRPTLTTVEYFRMLQRVGDARMQEHQPYYIGPYEKWSFGSHSCPCSTDSGCSLPHDERPLVCRLFPYVPFLVLKDDNEKPHWDLYLDVERCPRWKEFGDKYGSAKEEFDRS